VYFFSDSHGEKEKRACPLKGCVCVCVCVCVLVYVCWDGWETGKDEELDALDLIDVI
jgi:hypothetical protein